MFYFSTTESWLEEVDIFVCAETPAVGDLETLEAQLEQSKVISSIAKI